MRRHLSFDCAGAALAATLDEAAGTTGLLIVSGGNEVRSGPFRGKARLAARLAAAGHPVFRFDRRGVGDSGGENAGFEGSGEDIRAAITAFRRAAPQLTRIVGLGNCDAASALLLHQPLALDALVLANIWTLTTAAGEAEAAAAPALDGASVRARYAARLKDPRQWWRLVSGGVNLAKLARGLAVAARAPQASPLGGRVADALGALDRPTHILLAQRDRTAAAFLAVWHSPACAAARANPALTQHIRDTASHSFAGIEDADWLAEQILAALAA